MKTIPTTQAKVQFAYFVQRDQHGIIAKYLSLSSILMRRFRCSSRGSFLNSLIANNCPSQDFNHPDDLFNQGMLLLGPKYFLIYST